MLLAGVSSIENMLYWNFKNRRKAHFASFSRFNTSMESAMEHSVVMSSFVLMNHKPQHLFARLNPRSTSIQSMLSLYAVLSSSRVYIFRTPQHRNGYVNTFAFAKCPVIPVTVYLINQHSLRIVTDSLSISLYRCNEHIRLVVSVKR